MADPEVTHRSVIVNELVAAVPVSGENVGVATVWNTVYTAAAVALSAMPALNALALTVVFCSNETVCVYTVLDEVGSAPVVVYRIVTPSVRHEREKSIELVAAAPVGGSKAGAAAYTVYVAVTVALSAMPDLNALALMTADCVRVIVPVYAVLSAFGVEPSAV